MCLRKTVINLYPVYFLNLKGMLNSSGPTFLRMHELSVPHLLLNRQAGGLCCVGDMLAYLCSSVSTGRYTSSLDVGFVNDDT